jgi:maleylacetate reductase
MHDRDVDHALEPFESAEDERPVRPRTGERDVEVIAPGRGEAQAREVADALGGRSADVLGLAVMHTPTEVTERAMQVVRESAADGIVAVGGGSTTGLGKAIALRTDLP